MSAGWNLQSDQGGAVGKRSPAAPGRPDGADSLAHGRDRRANGQKAGDSSSLIQGRPATFFLKILKDSLCF